MWRTASAVAGLITARNATLGAGVHLHLEPTGGHLGYVSRDLPQYRWMDYALGHYLDALMSQLATR